MTDAQMQQLTDVNSEVNAVPFEEVPGPREPFDFWTDAPVQGDSWVCRDISEYKASKLRALGWDVHQLLTLCCYTEPVSENGAPAARQYHCILSVTVGDEEYVLDNRMPYPYQSNALPYDYVGYMRQIVGTDDFEPYSFPTQSRALPAT